MMDLSQLITGDTWQGVRYGTTTRDMLGASKAPFDQFNLGLHCGDNPEHVLANRKRLATVLPSCPIWLHQVHGTHVLDVDSGFAYSPWADAALTTQAGQVLAVMTADCLPVVIADEQASVVGIAHAGWRGLQAGILERLVDCMRFKVPSAVFKAWIGPAISQYAFEVGKEVYEAFVKTTPALSNYFVCHTQGPEMKYMSSGMSREVFSQLTVPDKYFADLAGIAEFKLRQKGIFSIQQSRECTYLKRNKYFSYRRENPTGRIVTLVWLER